MDTLEASSLVNVKINILVISKSSIMQQTLLKNSCY